MWFSLLFGSLAPSEQFSSTWVAHSHTSALRIITWYYACWTFRGVTARIVHGPHHVWGSSLFNNGITCVWHDSLLGHFHSTLPPHSGGPWLCWHGIIQFTFLHSLLCVNYTSISLPDYHFSIHFSILSLTLYLSLTIILFYFYFQYFILFQF